MTEDSSLVLLERHLKKNYPCGVRRKDIGVATGNILNPLTCRNADSKGTGIKNRRLIGKHTVYANQDIIEFIGTITKKR